jgi:hypothetical protein
MPKESDLNELSPHDLRQIERMMNGRPRKTLGWLKPSEKLEEVILRRLVEPALDAEAEGRARDLLARPPKNVPLRRWATEGVAKTERRLTTSPRLGYHPRDKRVPSVTLVCALRGPDRRRRPIVVARWRRCRRGPPRVHEFAAAGVTPAGPCTGIDRDHTPWSAMGQLLSFRRCMSVALIYKGRIDDISRRIPERYR